MPPRNKILIEFEGSLSIQKVEKLFADFKSHLEGPDSLQLDFSKVTDLDFAVLQLLLSLKKSFLEMDKQIEIQNVTPEIAEWFKLSDLTSLITQK